MLVSHFLVASGAQHQIMYRASATELMSRDRAGDWNQSLMELGATVCTPRKPTCAECPVRYHCKTYQRAIAASADPVSAAERLPLKAPKALPRLEWVVSVVPWYSQDDARIDWGLQRRSDEGVLAGQWGFPHRVVLTIKPDARAVLTSDGEVSTAVLREALQSMRAELSLDVDEADVSACVEMLPSHVCKVVHKFSHIEQHHIVAVLPLRAPDTNSAETNFKMMATNEVCDLGLSTLACRVWGGALGILYSLRSPRSRALAAGVEVAASHLRWRRLTSVLSPALKALLGTSQRASKRKVGKSKAASVGPLDAFVARKRTVKSETPGL